MENREFNGHISRKLERNSSQICPQPEEELLLAVLSNDTLKIEKLVGSQPSLLQHRYVEKVDNTILLVACSEKGVRGETVKTLLDLGANRRDKTSQEWEALHCAAGKGDFKTLQEVLRTEPGKIINVPAGGLNALHVLIRYSKVDPKDLFRCAELLINKGININHGDKNNRTASFWAKKKGMNNIEQLLENALNTQTKDEEDLSSEEINQLSVKDKLIKYLKERREDDLLRIEENIDDVVDETDSESTLLQICCEKGLTKATNYLLQRGADVNKITTINQNKPIRLATENGYSKIVKILLERGARITTDLLCICLKNIDSVTHNYKDCYDELMKNLVKKDPDEQLSILNGKDQSSYSPLHYAVRYADSNTLEELLKFGASLGSKNNYGIMPIEDIEPKILEKHLDNCVRFDKDKKSEKEDFQVRFDYRSLIPPYLKILNCSSRQDDKILMLKQLQIDPEAFDLKKELVNETEVIYFMSTAAEFKHLLKHPVISSFLFMKWRRIQWLFWVNLWFYVAFLLSLILYIFTDYAYFSSTEPIPSVKLIGRISYVVLFVTLLILAFREIFQMVIATKNYFRAYENYIEIVLIIITITIVFCESSYDTRKQLSAVAILLAAFELVLILGQHPYFSTNVVMLKTVSFNFFKFLGWYSILIIAFALSFFLLFTPSNITVQEAISAVGNTKNESSKSDEKEETFFDDPYKSVFKTVIMLTGEFDAGSINFNTFPVTSKIIFALFIFMIAIILLNLLNGLAVSDTQMIKNDAELVGYIARAKHVRYVETILLGNIVPVNFMEKISDICCCLPVPKFFHWSICRSFAEYACLFPKYLNYELILYPNRRGNVQVDTGSQSKGYRKSCFSCSGVFLDRETVRRTQSIIQSQKERNITDNIDLLMKKLDSILNIIDPKRQLM